MKFEIEIYSKLSAHELELGLAKTLQIWQKYDSIQSFGIENITTNDSQSLTYEDMAANKIKQGCSSKIKVRDDDNWLCGYEGHLCRECKTKLYALQKDGE